MRSSTGRNAPPKRAICWRKSGSVHVIMLFVEFRFFWFFLAVFCVYWALRENRSRKIWLLICSYIFYAAWDWRFLFLLIGSSALDYFVGMMLARTKNPAGRRGWL